jgi:HAD superfamily hydrolase (TIGR01509 family)
MKEMLNVPIDTLIFDLDNTLIDRNQALRLTIEDWLQSQGYDASQCQSALDDIMRKDDWGYTDRTEFCSWLLQTYATGENKRMSAQQLLDLLLQNIVHHFQPNVVVNTTLQKVGRHFRLVLATNGGSIVQRGKLKQVQLQSFFQSDAVFVSGEMGYEKPNPQFFKKIIHDLQLDPQKAIVIGDNPVNDIQAAAACGLLTCWVSYGRSLANDIHPNQVITNIMEIGTWIQQ